MDLSSVPLQVLEKVRNKWEKITDRCDPAIGDLCAMCDYITWCYACPIWAECREILDSSVGWNERRERFLLGIRAEIESRAEVA